MEVSYNDNGNEMNDKTPEPVTTLPDNNYHSKPSAHFSPTVLEYEYEKHPAEDDEDHDKQKQRERRASHRASVILDNTINNNGNGTPFDVSFHPGRLTLYSHPRQRQSWGDTQVLPRVNWGDLFFDLYYVAAAYNTSNILVDSPTGKGVLYFLGTFFPLMGIWLDKVMYDAKFVVGDDLFHRLYELVNLVILSTAVLHLRTQDVLANSADNVDMFAFCLAILLANGLTMLRNAENYFFGIGRHHDDGQDGNNCVLRQEAKRWWFFNTLNVVLILVATIITGREYYGNNDNDSHGDDYSHHTEEEEAHYPYSNTTNTDNPDDYNNRMLAAAASTSGYATEQHDTTDLPVILLLIGYISKVLILAVNVCFFFPSDGTHKELMIPLNVDFVIHRNGEWNMLMLGESLLSLLIVDVPAENDAYYGTFYSALLTVILLQYLHFRSQPHHADGHAIRRNKDAGIIWSFLHGVYSAALVALGAAFTLMVLEYSYEESEEEAHEYTSSSNAYDTDIVTDNDDHHRQRFLAGGGGEPKYTLHDRRQRTAYLFCFSMALIWICLDCMTLSHLGLRTSHNRCQCEKSKKFNIKGILLVWLRVGLIVFMATLSLYETYPEYLAVVGLFGVLLQLILRKLGTKYLSGSQVHALDESEDAEDEKWPNVTHAVAEPANGENAEKH